MRLEAVQPCCCLIPLIRGRPCVRSRRADCGCPRQARGVAARTCPPSRSERGVLPARRPACREGRRRWRCLPPEPLFYELGQQRLTVARLHRLAALLVNMPEIQESPLTKRRPPRSRQHRRQGPCRWVSTGRHIPGGPAAGRGSEPEQGQGTHRGSGVHRHGTPAHRPGHGRAGWHFRDHI